MRITQQNIKDCYAVAKHTGEPETFSHKRTDGDYVKDARDIFIAVTIHPEKDVNRDIYPFIEVKMVEEEFTKTVLFGIKEAREVVNIFNQFTAQTDKSFLETFYNL